MALGDVALNGVGQSIHTGGSGQALGHGSHHIGIDDRDLRDIVGIHADELALLLHVGNDIVDGDLGSGTGSGGHCNGEYRVLLGGSHALQRADIRKLGVVDDHANGLSGIHGGAAADGHDAVCLRGLKSSHAVLHVGNGGVGLDLAVHAVSKICSIQQVGHFLGDAELDQIRVRADERFLVATGSQLGHNVLDGTVAMVRNRIQDNAISHNSKPPNILFPAPCGVFFTITLPHC